MPEDWRRRAIRWLRKGNPAQQSWAINYLGKKGWFLRGRGPDELSYDYLVTHIRNAPETLEKEDDLRKMKRAWSQKGIRDEKGPRKSYSFTMSKSIGPKLRQLAKERGEPAYKTLEAVILGYRDIVKSKAWVDLSRNQLENRLQKVDLELKEAESKRKELEAREEELQRQTAALKRRTEELQRLEDEVLEYGEALDNKRDLISDLFVDYKGLIRAQALNKLVFVRNAILPPAPLDYRGRSKACDLIEPYEALLASLKR